MHAALLVDRQYNSTSLATRKYRRVCVKYKKSQCRSKDCTHRICRFASFMLSRRRLASYRSDCCSLRFCMASNGNISSTWLLHLKHRKVKYSFKHVQVCMRMFDILSFRLNISHDVCFNKDGNIINYSKLYYILHMFNGYIHRFSIKTVHILLH